MRKLLAASFLFTVMFGCVQLPAHAEFNNAFGRHDHNHDGRWNRREFCDANNNYYRHHHTAEVIDNRNEFNRLDRNGDGYLNREEVRTYHNW
jgi:Ca2+-binding EF-hand superfamily protein